MPISKDRKAAHDRAIQPVKLNYPIAHIQRVEEDNRVLGISNGMRKPDILRELTEQHHDLIEMMVHGPEVDVMGHKAKWPLTLIEAADLLGIKRRNARQLSTELIFVAEFNKQLVALRKMEGPRNVRTMISIRDHKGENDPSDRQVRLKAADMIEGKDKSGINVSVAVNTQNNVVAPGYVIRLPSFVDQSSPSHPHDLADADSTADTDIIEG